MKISNNFPQFEDEPTLIITAGWQDSKVYYAYQGEIVLNKEVRVPSRKYSDREGYFETRSNVPGVSVKAGSVYEENKHHVREKFLNKLSGHIDDLVGEHKIKGIYLFSASEGLKSLKEEFSPEIKKLIKKSYEGNYTHYPPDKLVELIKEKRTSPVKAIKEEAKKILDRTKRMFGK